MKHTTIHHFLALAFLAMSSVLFLSSWMSSRIEDNMPLFITYSIVAILVGYIRPYLSIWFRWIILIVVFVSICMVTDGNNWGISWMAMLLCLFSWSISIRRFVMQKAENTMVANKSVLRALYDLLDETYRNIASAADEKFKTDTFTTMVPVTHAAFILSFSLLFLYISMDSYESNFEGYGYAVYSGMMAVIPIIYALRNSRHGHDFLSSLLAAIVMFLVGTIAMIMCFIIAIFSFIAINVVITAISNLLRKLFGE